jgi:hypothetical protein
MKQFLKEFVEGLNRVHELKTWHLFMLMFGVVCTTGVIIAWYTTCVISNGFIAVYSMTYDIVLGCVFVIITILATFCIALFQFRDKSL